MQSWWGHQSGTYDIASIGEQNICILVRRLHPIREGWGSYV